MLDDMSQQILNVDVDLLENSTFGLYVSNSTKSAEVKRVDKHFSPTSFTIPKS